MPHVNGRPLQTITNKMVTVKEEKAKYRKSINKRLITRIKHLQNERETEVFIEDQLRLTEEEQRTTEEVHKKIHQLFSDNIDGFKARFTDLIRSGSLEKGTAIRGMTDVDLVLYFSPTPSFPESPAHSPINSPTTKTHFNFDIRPTATPPSSSLERLRRKHEKVQTLMREILGKNGEKIAHEIVIQHQNPYVDQLNFQSTPSAPSYQVDLTLAVDFDPPSPYVQMPIEFVERVKRDSGNFFSSSFTREQNLYIRNQPERVKDLIRLVKFWYKTDVPDLTIYPATDCKFKSYLFELLTIGVWRTRLSKSLDFEMLRAFKTVLKTITQHETMYLVVGEQEPASTIISDRPLIVGPNNEYENVAKSGKNWKELSRIAKVTMNENNLREVQPYYL